MTRPAPVIVAIVFGLSARAYAHGVRGTVTDTAGVTVTATPGQVLNQPDAVQPVNIVSADDSPA